MLNNFLATAQNAENFIESLFSIQLATESLTFSSACIMIFSALALGLISAIVYILTQKKIGEDTTLSITLVMIPAIVTLVVMLIGNNVARAFTLAGAFSLIRYRSNPATPKDIAYVFLSLAIGLCCGMGYIVYAIAFSVLMLAIMLIISASGFGMPKSRDMQLKILIPENLNFEGAFDDILKEYTDFYKLTKVKTSDFGTLFELVYALKFKKGIDKKEFLDKIRCRNGNLNIVLIMCADKNDNN